MQTILSSDTRCVFLETLISLKMRSEFPKTLVMKAGDAWEFAVYHQFSSTFCIKLSGTISRDRLRYSVRKCSVLIHDCDIVLSWITYVLQYIHSVDTTEFWIVKFKKHFDGTISDEFPDVSFVQMMQKSQLPVSETIAEDSNTLSNVRLET